MFALQRILRTSSGPHDPINLLTRFHCTQVKHLHDWPRPRQLRRVIWWWSKLFQHLPPNPSCRLLVPDHRTIPEIAFYKKLHFLIARKHAVAANCVKPALDRGLDARLIFFCACTSGRDSSRNSWNEGLWVGGDEMFAEFEEF